MDDERRRAQQASRTNFLRQEAERQKKASETVLKAKMRELDNGLVPSSLVEADFLLQRVKEVSAADGLSRTARHRREMVEKEESLTALERERETTGQYIHSRATDAEVGVGLSEMLSSSVQAVSSRGDAAPSVSSPEFVSMDAAEVEARISSKAYVERKTAEEIEQERIASLQSKRERLQEQRRSLPIYSVRDELVRVVRENQVVVLVGETGSGKTTQVLQYLREEGLHLPQPDHAAKAASTTDTTLAEEDGGEEEELRFVCTQPRRIAAMSVAERVALEVGCRCGSTVGYKVRFDDCSGPLTRILYLTDGMMLKEFTADPNLGSVAAIMVDEAHERSLNTDILLGLLRDVIRRNTRLRVIVASATINAEKFSRFFGGAPVFTVTGRTYPVSVYYSDQPVADYVTESAQTVIGLHMSKPLPGDILVFLPGQDAIETCAETLRQYVAEAEGHLRQLLILPVYSSLPPKEQARIYEPTPPNVRKVVIATNIAETSITIDGVVFVVDCGLVKQDYYNPKAMVEELRVVPTSQASATQRAGRAGRTQRGECFRLFTAYTFKNELPAETIPEIMRCSMSAVVLQLKALGVHNLLQFDFIDPPSTESLERALDHLFLLGAMKGDGRLTVTGRRMAEFPMDPSLSKCLVRGCALGCGRHMAMAAAMLTLDSVFISTRDPKEKQHIESAKSQLFAFGNGDVAGYVRILDEWLRAGPHGTEFCKTYCIHPRTMVRARDVLDQILKTFDRIGLDMKEDAAGTGETETATAARLVNVELLTKALLSGYFFNVARIEADKHTYRMVRPMDTGAPSTGSGWPAGLLGSSGDDAPTAELHPSSYLFRAGRKGASSAQAKPSAGVSAAAEDGGIPPVLREKPSLVVFTQLRRTTKRYMIHVSAVSSPDAVLEAAPVNYFQREELETTLRKRPRS